MALNIFKKNTDKGVENKAEEKKAEKGKKLAQKKAKDVKDGLKKGEAKNKGYEIGTIKIPYITEKAVSLSEKDIYVFKVDKNANKTSVKKAVEEAYKVDVEKVSMANAKRRKTGRGRLAGFKKGFKKAMVKIKKGQKIEVMPK
ncbi:MAG: 50S ribosomal protein L23 [Candidatus Paceibacterota bacterium]|jgi:large subunit ribosomal protein L23|nr:50S ribosomal protein L23 [Candidatus Paceibacterota bacterium]MDD4830789.1 50S ribosomal protein L23 [Candidatus Paceibacterota bacterium]MDD4875289.1 50S ribosomal protein L23 [Candidatus Paceibacterota bacterium]